DKSTVRPPWETNPLWNSGLTDEQQMEIFRMWGTRGRGEGGGEGDGAGSGDAVPTLSPEQARQAKPGTRYRGQDGKIRVR
ncbi:MAG TPA: hypothetical protein PK406_08200, partial [Verrucomicrobiota bacterium]|nr:hypothetical protein [Verrucomicrobiota bacterium]